MEKNLVLLISVPLMIVAIVCTLFASLATYLLLESVEYRKTKGRSKVDFILTFIAALFVYAVVIYNVFIR